MCGWPGGGTLTLALRGRCVPEEAECQTRGRPPGERQNCFSKFPVVGSHFAPRRSPCSCAGSQAPPSPPFALPSPPPSPSGCRIAYRLLSEVLCSCCCFLATHKGFKPTCTFCSIVIQPNFNVKVHILGSFRV